MHLVIKFIIFSFCQDGDAFSFKHSSDPKSRALKECFSEAYFPRVLGQTIFGNSIHLAKGFWDGDLPTYSNTIILSVSLVQFYVFFQILMRFGDISLTVWHTCLDGFSLITCNVPYMWRAAAKQAWQHVHCCT